MLRSGRRAVLTKTAKHYPSRSTAHLAVAAKRLWPPLFSGHFSVRRVGGETIEKGSIVWLEYDGWVVNPDGTTRLFDTTHEEAAKREGKYDEKKVYAEMPVVLQPGRLLPGLEEAVLSAKVGAAQEVVIPPAKGAGERDPKLVELRALREFLKQEIDPEVGMEVALGGKRGTVTAVTGGRVRIDFNNPLAGRTLRYAFTVTRKASAIEEKVRGILEMDYGLADQFRISVHERDGEIVVPDICKTDERWFVAKFRAVADLREFSGLRKVRFVEEYEKKEPSRPEEKPAEAAAPAAKAEAPAPDVAAKPKRARRKAKPKPAAQPTEEKAPEEL